MARSTINHLFDDIIKRYPDTKTAELAQDLGISIKQVYRVAHYFNVKKSEAYTKNWKEQSAKNIKNTGIPHRYKKGAKSWNKGKKLSDYVSPESYKGMQKTQFKKGSKSANEAEDGAIRLRNDKSGKQYYFYREAKSKWVLYHRKIWIDANGPIPKKHIIVFIDRNPLNVVLENLECITYEANMLRNTLHRYPENIKQTVRTLTKLKKLIKNGSQQN